MCSLVAYTPVPRCARRVRETEDPWPFALCLKALPGSAPSLRLGQSADPGELQMQVRRAEDVFRDDHERHEGSHKPVGGGEVRLFGLLRCGAIAAADGNHADRYTGSRSPGPSHPGAQRPYLWKRTADHRAGTPGPFIRLAPSSQPSCGSSVVIASVPEDGVMGRNLSAETVRNTSDLGAQSGCSGPHGHYLLQE